MLLHLDSLRAFFNFIYLLFLFYFILFHILFFILLVTRVKTMTRVPILSPKMNIFFEGYVFLINKME